MTRYGCWRTSIVVFCFAASGVLGGASPAWAASITCPDLIGNSPHIADNVTPSTGCGIGSTNNDFLGIDPTSFQVNLDAMFGFADWQFAGKTLEEESGLDIGLGGTGGPVSGTWSIDDIWTSQNIANLMLVFKAGVSKDPGNYVGYLIATGATSGSYVTPFRTPTGRGGASDISHISAYIRLAAPDNPGTGTPTDTDTGSFPEPPGDPDIPPDTNGPPDTSGDPYIPPDQGDFPDTSGDPYIPPGTDTSSQEIPSVPEPSGLLLLGAGFAMLARARRRTSR